MSVSAADFAHALNAARRRIPHARARALPIFEVRARRFAHKWLAGGIHRVQIGDMKTSVDLDDELQAEVERTVSLVREKPATVLRLAIRAGLPLVASRFQAPRPEGYFASDYPMSDERIELEKAMAGSPQHPDR